MESSLSVCIRGGGCEGGGMSIISHYTYIGRKLDIGKKRTAWRKKFRKIDRYHRNEENITEKE